MPALSYKERFVPFVKDGSKSQSIRAFRKHPFKPGQTLMHYYGMRTKSCTKIRENTTANDVTTIFILTTGFVVLGPWMEEKEAKEILTNLEKPRHANTAFLDKRLKWLSFIERDVLAWQDGFRKDEALTDGCFTLMFRWWNQTHALPFTGQLIKWK